jgi:hypothetical protein
MTRREKVNLPFGPLIAISQYRDIPRTANGSPSVTEWVSVSHSGFRNHPRDFNPPKGEAFPQTGCDRAKKY